MNKKILIGSIISIIILVGVSSTPALSIIINSDNSHPKRPIISGPVRVSPEMYYNWTFNATDPDGDNVYYWINWGRGSATDEWIGPFTSGEEVIRNHSYPIYQYYTISARAKDIHGAIGPWEYIQVEVPKRKQINNLPFFQWLNQLIFRIFEGWI